MKILLDMNLSPIWVGYLAAHNFEAVHWSEIGDPKADDSVIMDFVGDMLIQALVDHASSLARGALITLEPNSLRARILPIIPGNRS